MESPGNKKEKETSKQATNEYMHIILNKRLVPTEVPRQCFDNRTKGRFASSTTSSSSNSDYKGSTMEHKTNLVYSLDRLKSKAKSGADEKLACVNNNFLRTVWLAYTLHLPLRVRPDDFMYQIAASFMMWVTENSESLRAELVGGGSGGECEGEKKGLDVMVSDTWIEGLAEMTDLIAQNTIHPDIVSLLRVKFSTTTPLLQQVRDMAVLGTFSTYFNYAFVSRCGIPSVHMEGTIEDWRLLRDTFDALVDTLPQLKPWHDRLAPVLQQLYETRKLSEDGVTEAPEKVARWWSHIISSKEPQGSGAIGTLTGWLGAFFACNDKGVFFDRDVPICEIPQGMQTLEFRRVIGGVSFMADVKFGMEAPHVTIDDQVVECNHGYEWSRRE